jgi:hypothetical protein
MSRATLRIGCQDGHVDALAHMVGSAASGACLMTSRRAPGVLSQKCAFRIRIHHIRSDRFARQEYAFVGEPSFGLEEFGSRATARTQPRLCRHLLHDYENIDNALHSHARQPAEHRVALVASLWGQHTRGQHIRDPRAESSIPRPVRTAGVPNSAPSGLPLHRGSAHAVRRGAGEPACCGSSHPEITLRDADHHADQQHFATAHVANGSDSTGEPFRVESRARAGGS